MEFQSEDIRSSIMPSLGKLLDLTTNPKKVIQKHTLRQPEYTKFHSLQASKGTRSTPIDRTLLTSAQEFVALHQQLLEELPAFLEGYLRIMDLVVVEFTGVQGRYFGKVKEEVERFSLRWISKPRKGGRAAEVENREMDGKAIVKAWSEAWGPYGEAMEHFQCTKPCERFQPILSISDIVTFSPCYCYTTR
jgi:hypothetical protein